MTVKVMSSCPKYSVSMPVNALLEAGEAINNQAITLGELKLGTCGLQPFCKTGSFEQSRYVN